MASASTPSLREPLPAKPRVQAAERAIALATVLVPLIGFLVAVAYSWTHGWLLSIDVVLLAIMYTVSTLGVTAGYHRLFAHRSFQAHPRLRQLLGIAGSMAAQGPLFYWVATHRVHHQHSDSAEDPHSPHQLGARSLGILRGFWHAHIAWMIRPAHSDWSRLVPDLLKERPLCHLHFQYLTWVGLGILIPGGIGALLGGGSGFIRGLLWGGLARIFLVHQVTWSVNSICHLYGTRRFVTNDHSQNHLLVGWAAFGEGFHNNHHAFPQSARHGWRWFEFDLTYAFLRALAAFGWVRDLRLPTDAQLTAKEPNSQT